MRRQTPHPKRHPLRSRKGMRVRARLGIALASSLVMAQFAAPDARAERIVNPIGMFSGLDKITAVTSSFEAKVGEEVAFGSLKIKLFACYTRPITERPDTSAFIQVFTANQTGKAERIFSGWMFAESPGLNALENPVYDIWLTGCRDPDAPPPPVEAAPAETAPSEPGDPKLQDGQPED
jgi:hypothetical protein